MRDTIRKRKQIVAKVKSKYWKTTHKYGIRMPKDVREAEEIDRTNGNTLWMDAILKEMQKVSVAYEAQEGLSPSDIRQGKAPQLVGFQEIRCHLIFDVKMDFTRKARFVAGGAYD